MLPGPARFDSALQAWVLSSHEEVGAALRDPHLAAGSSDPTAVHLALRDAAAHTLSADRLASWHAAFERSALERAAALPADRPIDLVASFAAPWALSLAVSVTGAPPAAAAELADLARQVFLAAAFRTDDREQPESLGPAAALARRLPGAEGTIDVQAFVALSQTLPHLLGGVWLELFGQPDAARRVRDEPRLSTQALEELLRLAGPAHAVFRRARADVRIGGASIRAGDRVVLLLAAASRDPARFPDPDKVDLDRAARDHHAFGGGAHACSGARLVRAAALTATDALLRTTDTIELLAPVTWIDGFAIRAPASLPAVLRRVAPRPSDVTTARPARV
jgi:hypothetical protein